MNLADSEASPTVMDNSQPIDLSGEDLSWEDAFKDSNAPFARANY